MAHLLRISSFSVADNRKPVVPTGRGDRMKDALVEQPFFPYLSTNELDGSNGTNRGDRTKCMLRARNDDEAIHAFLVRFEDSPETYRTYTREVKRLRLWAAKVLNKPISSLLAEDVEEYNNFLKNIPADWLCSRSVGRHEARWRPFAKQLAATSVRQAMVSVLQLFSYLVDGGYLAANPMFGMRFQRRTSAYAARKQVHKRMLTDNQWETLVGYLDSLNSFEGERTRFIIAMLFFLGLRISELIKGKMNSFEWRSKGSQWWFIVEGKGNKLRDVGVPAALMRELARWRGHLGLPDKPQSDEYTPLLRRSQSQNEGLAQRRTRQIVKEAIEAAADLLEDPREAQAMRAASAHWFRHDQFTQQGEHGIDLEDTRENAGHASVDTTLIYRHANDDRRYKQVQGMDWKRKKKVVAEAHNIVWEEDQ